MCRLGVPWIHVNKSQFSKVQAGGFTVLEKEKECVVDVSSTKYRELQVAHCEHLAWHFKAEYGFIYLFIVRTYF